MSDETVWKATRDGQSAHFGDKALAHAWGGKRGVVEEVRITQPVLVAGNDKAVIINGVRYIPDPNVPNRIGIWYAHDNHMFSRVKGNSLDAIIAHASVIEVDSPYGCLCGPIVMHDRDELYRISVDAHSHGPDDRRQWQRELKLWRKAVEIDTEAMRLIGERNERRT